MQGLLRSIFPDLIIEMHSFLTAISNSKPFVRQSRSCPLSVCVYGRKAYLGNLCHFPGSFSFQGFYIIGSGVDDRNAIKG